MTKSTKKKKASKSEQPTRPIDDDVEEVEIEFVPVIAISDIAPLPGLVLPVTLSNPHGIKALEEAIKEDHYVGLVLRRDSGDHAPTPKELCEIGGLAQIVNYVRLPNGDCKVRLHVLSRMETTKYTKTKPYLLAEIDIIPETSVTDLTKKEQEKQDVAKDKLKLLGDYDRAIEDHIFTSEEVFHSGILADLIATLLPLQPAEFQRVVETVNPSKRLDLATEYLDKQLSALAIRKTVSNKVEVEFEQIQRREILKEQLKQIQAELGEEADAQDDLEELAERIKSTKLSDVACKEAEKQLRRLKRLHSDSSESALARTYLDCLLELPWGNKTRDRLDLIKAKKILDEEHYGLEQTKERVLDFLGVRKLKKTHKGPVLLLVGPPGVGKTSLGMSVAKALGRKFVRLSLGGLRDEAELRGHRRTYVGALPGRIIQGVSNAGSTNPVFMLDEIDKVGNNFRGDPASVLLEVLDPEQNKSFDDHYLNVPFDLSGRNVYCNSKRNRFDSSSTPRSNGSHRNPRLHTPRKSRNCKKASGS